MPFKHPVALIFALLIALGSARADHGLPTLIITTADGTDIDARAWRPQTTVRLLSAGKHTLFVDNRAKVKARGHSSFEKPKKPFALKLSRARSLLGMPATRRWVLIAGFMDHSLLRNRLALAVAQQTALDWTPTGRMVWVVQNGCPMGLYMLAQQIHTGRHAVRVARRGGFLIEMDAYPSTRHSFVTPWRHLPVHVRHPRHPTRRATVAIEHHLYTIEQALYATAQPDSAAMGRLLDLTSFADYYLVQELCQNAECNGPRSTYMHLAPDGRLHAGPVWDFDLAFIPVGLDGDGNLRPARFALPGVHRLTTDSAYCAHALWYDRLLAMPSFERLLCHRWAQLAPNLRAVADSLPPVGQPRANRRHGRPATMGRPRPSPL